jgi:hydroxypyruvate reductase
VIGSGPTVPDPTTLAVLARYRLDVPEAVARALADAANETPKPGASVFAGASFDLAMRPAKAFNQIRPMIGRAGFERVLLGTDIQGEARDVAAEHARMALGIKSQGRRAVIFSGGELTVTLRGKGRGGPNQEYLLALAIALQETDGITALAADTDGTDGGGGDAGDPAGALADPSTMARARALGLDPAAFLADNNSTEFFEKLGDLLAPGPTCTNINDFRAILVDRP